MGGTDSSERKGINSPRAKKKNLNRGKKGDTPEQPIEIKTEAPRPRVNTDVVNPLPGDGGDPQAPGLLAVEYPPGFRKGGRGDRRRSVSAEVDRDPNQVQTKKFVYKSADVCDRIRELLETNSCFLFGALDANQKGDILNAMEEVKVKAGEDVVTQYDYGDHFYVVESGDYDVLKTFGPKEDPGEVKHVFQYEGSGYFGELALMYNNPRAATVRARTDGVLYAVDRQSFQDIIIMSTRKKRELYEEFIESVKLLQNLNQSERSQVVDALAPREFKKGEFVMKQGDGGDELYLIESGTARVTQTITKPDGTEEELEINTLTKGDYFGERALIKNDVRSANIIADSETINVLAISRDTFERLFGSLKLILGRHMSHYKDERPGQDNEDGAEEAAVEDAVAEEAAVEDAVAEEAAVEDAVAEEAAVEDAVAEEAAVEDAVAEEDAVEENEAEADEKTPDVAAPVEEETEDAKPAAAAAEEEESEPTDDVAAEEPAPAADAGAEEDPDEA